MKELLKSIKSINMKFFGQDYLNKFYYDLDLFVYNKASRTCNVNIMAIYNEKAINLSYEVAKIKFSFKGKRFKILKVISYDKNFKLVETRNYEKAIYEKIKKPEEISIVNISYDRDLLINKLFKKLKKRGGEDD
jgi:hypothetical protein